METPYSNEHTGKPYYEQAVLEAQNLSDIELRDQLEVLKESAPAFNDSGHGDVSQAHAEMGREMIMREQKIAAYKKILKDRGVEVN